MRVVQVRINDFFQRLRLTGMRYLSGSEANVRDCGEGGTVPEELFLFQNRPFDPTPFFFNLRYFGGNMRRVSEASTRASKRVRRDGGIVLSE